MKNQPQSPYPLIARKPADPQSYGFSYNSVEFRQNNLQICAGLNAVDNIDNVITVMRTLQQFGLTCTRMGVFKPRTSPYSFQGLGEQCLPQVLEQAGKFGINVIAMEITHERYLDTLRELMLRLGNPTGILLQIGTRNIQNFELLKALGKQHEFPILLKRGYGITLEESLLAAEYLAHAGNQQIIFCLRGVKSIFAEEHRNFIDFSQISTVKRLTKLPVCVDPSHAVGNLVTDPQGIYDIFHAAAQGVICGANMLLIDIHPQPELALVDGQQAININKLPWLLEDIQITHAAYLQRIKRRRLEIFSCDQDTEICSVNDNICSSDV